jgi:hypothetical protein
MISRKNMYLPVVSKVSTFDKTEGLALALLPRLALALLSQTETTTLCCGEALLLLLLLLPSLQRRSALAFSSSSCASSLLSVSPPQFLLNPDITAAESTAAAA